MNFDVCLICCSAENTVSNPLRCPALSNSLDGGVDFYSDFLRRVEEFRQVEELPCDLSHWNDHDSEVTAENLFAKKAKVHRNCRANFSESRLKRAKQKAEKRSRQEHGEGQGSEPRTSKRRSTPGSKQILPPICIFCDTESKEKLINCSTFSVDRSIKGMATDLQDTTLLGKLAGADLPALEAKYHPTCLRTLKNRHRSWVTKTARMQCETGENEIHGRAFANTIEYMESYLNDNVYLFYLVDLKNSYEKCYHAQTGVHIDVHVTRLKHRIMNYFNSQYGEDTIQEQSEGKKIVLAFTQGMKEIIREAMRHQDYDKEAVYFSKALNKLRNDIFAQEALAFDAKFEMDCQNEAVPSSLKQMVYTLLYGNTSSTNNAEDVQQCLTISQLILYNCKKNSTNFQAQRHSSKREPPLPVYIGLKMHTETRSKELINILYNLGVSCSYDRVMQIEKDLEKSICNYFQKLDMVCPPHLRKGIYTVGAFDNIDHNPSSNTAQGSLHGSAISIFQFPTISNNGEKLESLSYPPLKTSKESVLPTRYTVIPSVTKSDSVKIPEKKPTKPGNQLPQAEAVEHFWTQESSNLLDKESLSKEDNFGWAAFHAAKLQQPVNPAALSAMLPIFNEKAEDLGMVKHAMGIQLALTNYLNANQIPVMAFDIPLYALSKHVQWQWPDVFGEGKFLSMAGGLHIEKALWTVLGDILDGSGWCSVLVESGITTAGKTNMMLSCSHIKRTRYVHQVTVVALARLKMEAYENYKADGGKLDGHQWHLEMLQKYPTFFFWDKVMNMIILVLVTIKAERVGNLELYIESLQKAIPWFFALDHYHYARWIPVFLRDLLSLEPQQKACLQEFWVLNKTQKRFSHIAIDQAHEQNNKVVKSAGGIIGLTENASALQRWLVVGPELSKLVTDFEEMVLGCEASSRKHHEENFSFQQKMHKHVKDLVSTINRLGNPFCDLFPELVTLDSRNCASEQVVLGIRSIDNVGKQQYEKYVENVLQKRNTSFLAPIKKNKIVIFKSKSKKEMPLKLRQVKELRNDCNLMSRMLVGVHERGGSLDEFFTHENQPSPPSLSDQGKLRLPKAKSELLKCLQQQPTAEYPENCHTRVIDGAGFIHNVQPKNIATFDEYQMQQVQPWINKSLETCTRLDIVWDRYLEKSLKDATRESRGAGIRRKVSGSAKIPGNFRDFLRHSDNKRELFSFLSYKLVAALIPEGKSLFVTNETSVLSKSEITISEADHEEADSRIALHVLDALSHGMNIIEVLTVDTDVVIILLGKFSSFLVINPSIDLWVRFMGKDGRKMHINKMYKILGPSMSNGLPMFHSLTGCDTVSQFAGRGKKTCFAAWQSFPDVTAAFEIICLNPFREITMESDEFALIERFVCVAYERCTEAVKVNTLREELFTKRPLENLPPTRASLFQHTKRAIYQASIWASSTRPVIGAPDPCNWGWILKDEQWKPYWTDLPDASKAISVLVKCGCKSDKPCRTNRCKCTALGLSCTTMCGCGGICDEDD